MGEARWWPRRGKRALGGYVEAVWEMLDLERLKSEPPDLELLELPELELLELSEPELLELFELLELPESELLGEDSLLGVLDSLAISRSFLRLLALLPWSFL